MGAHEHHDHVIVGAGPGGLQLALFLQQRGASYVVLERGPGPGMFFRTFPRHRRLISINKVFRGQADRETRLRWDWNSLLNDDLVFSAYSPDYFPHADAMVRYLTDFAERHQIDVRYDTPVAEIARRDDGFRLRAGGEPCTARRVIVATGVPRAYIPPIRGIRHAETYAEFSVDPEDFVDQRVLIIGKGNSAFETAENLISVARSIHLCSPSPVRLARETHFAGHVRAVNSNLLDTHDFRLQNAIINAEIADIGRADGEYVVSMVETHGRRERRELDYDRVLLCAGLCFDDGVFAPSCRPKTTAGGRLPEMTAEWESVNVPELFFAGTLMQARDHKRTMSAFIHGFRHNVRALDRMLQARDAAWSWPAVPLPAASRSVACRMLDRANSAPALVLQPGFFCDVVVPGEAEGEVRYVGDVPVDYVAISPLGDTPWQIELTVEYGDRPREGDPFELPRAGGVDGPRSGVLQPMLRVRSGGQVVDELWLEPDVANDFEGELFLRPLLGFLNRHLPVAAPVPERPLTAGRIAGTPLAVGGRFRTV